MMPSGSQIARVVLIAVISLVVGVSTFGALLKQPGPRQAMAARIVISAPPVESISLVASEPAEAVAPATAAVSNTPANATVSNPPANVVLQAPAALEQPVGSITKAQPAQSAPI